MPRTIVPEPAKTTTGSNTILEQINASDTIETLEGVYQLHVGEWTNELTAAAAERKALLKA